MAIFLGAVMLILELVGIVPRGKSKKKIKKVAMGGQDEQAQYPGWCLTKRRFCYYGSLLS